MESLQELLVTLVRLVSTITVIVLFFLFIVRPLLNYFIINHEIEHRKNLNDDLRPIPPKEAEADEHEDDESPVVAPPLSDDQDTLHRLATSDPDKAGDLVKQWVNSNQS